MLVVGHSSMGILENMISRYLTIIHSNEKYEKIFDRIRYLMTLKSNNFRSLFS